MRAPADKPLVENTFTAEQWRKIANSLPGGINLDTVIGPKVLSNGDPKERPLRDVLQALAWYFGEIARGRPPTAKQQVAELRKGVAKLQTARGIAAGIGIRDVLVAPVGQKQSLVAKYNDACSALTDLIAQWQRRLDRPLPNSGSSANARKAHIEYWTALRQVWLGTTTKQSQKSLYHFLVACSSPVFPEATTDKALDDFIGKAAYRKRRIN